MQVVTPDFVKDKKVLLRVDIDVPIAEGVVCDEFRLEAGIPTLKLCLENAREVVAMGHIGRPGGKIVDGLSVGPVYDWLGKRLAEVGIYGALGNKLKLLENLRFEKGEEECSLEYAKSLIKLADPEETGNLVFVNEAFASHHPSASTTVLPTLLPHAAGLHFAKEVETLRGVRENPKQPLIVIIGGVKIEDKLLAILQMAKIADKVLVGGKIAGELSVQSHQLSDNIYLANLRDDGKDIKEETVQKWAPFITCAKMILWNGPMGYIEDPKYNQTERISQLVIESGAESIVGGGDTVSYLNYLGDLPMFSFVSTGGGAMLEYLVKGTLPTTEVLTSTL